MCLAIPGKVVKMEGENLDVEYPGEIRKVTNTGLELKEGDYVLVQAKMAIEKLKPEEAKSSLDAWEEAIERLEQ